MGSVSSSTQEKHPLSLGTVFGSSTSASAASGSNSVAEHKDLGSRLSALMKDDVEFSSVQIVQVPLRSGVAQHHGLVYWYQVRGSNGPIDYGLQLDWGSDGLAFTDLYDKPSGTTLKTKESGILPVTVQHQVSKLAHKVYSLVQWNCQHFSLYLFDRACGNIHLNNKLVEMSVDEVLFTSVGIYYEAAEAVDAGEELNNSVLIYWHRERGSSRTLRGLRLDWSADGLTHRITGDPSEPLCERIRWRQCSLPPAKLLESLREIEGWRYEATTWSHKVFAQFLFNNVLAKGDWEMLRAHLEELGERGIEIAGVIDVLAPDPTGREASGDRHILVYKYKMLDQNTTVHLALEWGPKGLNFSESDEEPAGALLVRTKSMLFIRLRPAELQRQILEATVRSYDPIEWSSQNFCDRLFSLAPGKERGVLRAHPPIPQRKPTAGKTAKPARPQRASNPHL